MIELILLTVAGIAAVTLSILGFLSLAILFIVACEDDSEEE